VLSVIPRDFLDDMPRTMFTVTTRFYQMAALLKTWLEHMDAASLLGTRIEVTMLDTEKIVDARGLCCRLDLLRLQGLERHLQGPFEVHSIPIMDVVGDLQTRLRVLRPLLDHGNTGVPTLEVQSALTCARQALGWSSKNMRTHLRASREWMHGQAGRDALRAGGDYPYDGCESHGPETRALIANFLDNAHWFKAPNALPNAHKILLQRVRNGGQWKQNGKYTTRLEAAKLFIADYRAEWRAHVKGNPRA
jgi:hypothetical protein